MPSKVKRWFPLESNPEVMSKYVAELGLDTSVYEFHDVFSTEDWALSMVPRPVVAVLLLFPLTDELVKYSKELVEENEGAGREINANVYFMKQTVGNACGTVALLHAIGNLNDSSAYAPDSFLAKFLAQTKEQEPEEIAKVLENDDSLEEAHKAAASEGNSQQVESVDAKVDTHFVAFSHVDGSLYELDGRQSKPLHHGPSSADTLLEDACASIQKMIAREPKDGRFAIVAITKQK